MIKLYLGLGFLHFVKLGKIIIKIPSKFQKMFLELKERMIRQKTAADECVYKISSRYLENCCVLPFLMSTRPLCTLFQGDFLIVAVFHFFILLGRLKSV